MTRPLSLLIKPTGAECNLKCEYCFYLERPELQAGEGRTRMSDEVLESLIRNFMAVEQPLHAFCWQGGEPTLMGLPFFERVVELQQRFGRPGAVVANSVQTNGLLLDAALAAHFSRYRFLVGCSVDGPADVHDRYRVTAAGGPSHAAARSGIARLEEAGVPHDVLVVVSRANVDRPAEVYADLVAAGKLHHHYIPCLEADDDGEPLPFSITGEEWGAFLTGVFEAWSAGDVGRVSVRLFESIVAKMLTGRASLCTQGDCCAEYLVVEYDGGVYPCDFYVREDLRLGDVLHDSFEALRASPAYRAFGAEKSNLAEACRTCPQLDLCGGDCPRNRSTEADGSPGVSRLCAGWLPFFTDTRARFAELAAGIPHPGAPYS